MKKYTTIILLLLPLLFTGCFKWDQSGCESSNNCVLQFRLVGDGMLSGEVEIIDYTIFDQYGRFVMNGHMSVNSNDEDNAITLGLPFGDYKVVCWGNIKGESVLEDASDIDGCFVEVRPDAQTGSPLYYGPAKQENIRSEFTRNNQTEDPEYFFTVPKSGIVEKEIPFVRAHRRMNVYVKGAQYLDDNAGGMLVAEFTNLPYKYDFYRNSGYGVRNYERVMSEGQSPNGTMMPTANVTTPVYEFKDNMLIHLKTGGQKSVYHTFNLKEWVEKNAPKDINNFDILFTINKDVEVEVTLPDWDDIGLIPEV